MIESVNANTKTPLKDPWGFLDKVMTSLTSEDSSGGGEEGGGSGSSSRSGGSRKRRRAEQLPSAEDDDLLGEGDEWVRSLVAAIGPKATSGITHLGLCRMLGMDRRRMAKLQQAVRRQAEA